MHSNIENTLNNVIYNIQLLEKIASFTKTEVNYFPYINNSSP